MNKWQKFKIEDVCEFIGGSQPPKSTFINYPKEGYSRLVQTRDFKTDKFPTYIPTNSTTKFFKKEDIIIGRYGPPIFQIFRGSLEGAYNVALMKAVPNEKITNDFLYYFLIQKDVFEYVDKLSARTGGQTGVDLVSLNKYPINLPDKIEQQKIAKVLSDLDAKIELNNKINVELEAMAKLIYDYWFVQFDFPNEFRTVKTDEKGRHTELVEVKPYKSSGGKMVWSAELKREIPEGWEVERLKDIAQTGSGGTPLRSKTEYYLNGNIPWINSGEVNASFIVKTEKFITQEGMNKSSAKLFKKGTILMAMYGATAGQVSLIDIEACTNQAICGINPHNKEMTAYLKFGLEDLYKYLISLSSGSARDNLSQDKIRELHFVIPKLEILSDFDRQADAMLRKILVNMKENQKLAELRDWLLPMLMNGQVKVK